MGNTEIRSTLPTMKSMDGAAKRSAANDAAQSVKAAEEEKIDFSKVTIEPLFEEQVDFETFSKSDFRAVKVKACEAVPKSKKLLQFTLDDGTGTDRVILSGIHAYYEPECSLRRPTAAVPFLNGRFPKGNGRSFLLLSGC